jgi:hypothetical protein
MKKMLFLFAVTLTLFACDKDDDGLNLQLSMESCVLDNEHSYAEVKKLNGTGSLSVTSSDPGIAEICFDEKDKNVFYIIGHGQGSATITVMDVDYNKTGNYDIRTIDVNVRECIGYEYYSAQGVFIKKGESRAFSLPFAFSDNCSLIVDNDDIIDSDGVATVSASVEMGNQFKVDAKSCGSTSFHVCKGKVVLFSVRVYVVDEYDLFIPESENSQLTFDLPFTVGVNGISVWRGSGQYSAKVVDETVAVVESIILGNDWVNQMNNSAAVRVTPLKSGTTKLIVTDTVTGQTASVDVVVN